MTTGLDQLKHIVVLMMSSRSFDHMLGAMMAQNPAINGLTGNESNPDTTGAQIQVSPQAQFQGQLSPAPDHHFPGVDLQIFGGQQGSNRQPNMQGFIQSYFQQTNSVNRSHNVMKYFTPNQLPVLTTLANNFAVFNSWFSSVPGPTICNRAFAHYGTSFGQVGTDVFHAKGPYKSIYERIVAVNRAAKIYYYDQLSGTVGTASLLNSHPQLFATFNEFLSDCKSGNLPDYCFIEPNYNDHQSDAGVELASDQHPDHNVQQGEIFMSYVYNAILDNPDLWRSTALLIVYDEHGGIFDHVIPPACTSDGFTATSRDTGTGQPFAFDRLGVRVPAVLISPWVAAGTVIDGRTFEHASIPSTVTTFFIGSYDQRSPREKAADTFLDVLSDTMRPDSSIPYFNFRGAAAQPPRLRGDYNPVDIMVPDPGSADPNRAISDLLESQIRHLHELEKNLPPDQQTKVDINSIKTEAEAGSYINEVTSRLRRGVSVELSERTIAGFRSDTPEGTDLLGINRDVEALCSVLAAKDVQPPISIGLFGDWGSGKTFFMRQMENEFRYIETGARKAKGRTLYCSKIVQLWFNAWHYIDANLWASLVSHIFEELAEFVSPQKDDSQARAILLRELETSKELRADAEREKQKADRQKRETEDALKALASRRAETEAKLADLRLPDLRKLLEGDPDLKAEMEESLRSLGFSTTLENLENLEATFKEAHSLAGRFRTALLSMWEAKNRGTRFVLILLLLLGFPALSWILKSWLPPRWSLTRVGIAWGEMSILAASLTASITKYLRLGSGILTKLDSARQRVNKLLQEKKLEKSAEELRLEKDLNEIKAKEAGASQQFSEAQAKVREIEERIKDIDEGRSLSKFLLERVRTDDYRKHLGIVSSIRRDFETLDRLLRQGLAHGHVGEIEPIERIILYIDDLDRCPEDKVVEVLQAIHLLLFFPLFVVVVGVDPRWLLHSLRQHSRAFQGMSEGTEDFSIMERAHWQSTPLNYLEKIFQIPFAIQPMARDGFSRLVDNLTELQIYAKPVEVGNVAPQLPNREPLPPPPNRDATLPADRAPQHTEEIASEPKPDSGRTFDPNPRQLQMEQFERTFIQKLYPLIPSPRAAKRFVNVYRLLRTSVSDQDLAGFLGSDGQGEYQALQLLLAIQIGYPEQAIQIIEELVRRKPTEPWWSFVDGLMKKTHGRPEGEAQRWRELLDQLWPMKEDLLAGARCDDFIKWAPRVARYSFQSVRPL
jgi:phospholipase C